MPTKSNFVKSFPEYPLPAFSRPAGNEPPSGEPVLQFQTRDAFKVRRVTADKREVPAKRGCGNLDIFDPDWPAGTLQLGLDMACLECGPFIEIQPAYKGQDFPFNLPLDQIRLWMQACAIP